MKNIHLILLFLLLPLIVEAQSPESVALYAEGKNLYEAGDYKKAAETFIRVLNLDKEEIPDNGYNLDIVNNWISSSWYKAGDEAKALDYDPYFYQLEPVDRTLLADVYKYYCNATQSQDINLTVLWSERCMEEEVRILGLEHHLVRNSYASLAVFEFMRGNISASIMYNQKLKELDRIISSRVKTKAWMSEAAMVDAFVAERNGDVAAAIQNALKVWDCVKTELKFQTFAFKETFSLLMRCYYSAGELEKSSKLAAEAEAAFRSLDKDGAQLASQLVIYLADYYLNTVRYSDAVAIAEYALGVIDEEYSRARLNQAAAGGYMNNGDYQRAVSLMMESVATYSRLGAEGDLAVACYVLGQCYDGMRDFDESKRYFRQALKLFGKDKNTFAVSYSSTLCCLAAIETRTSKFDAALDWLNQAAKFAKANPAFFDGMHMAYLLKEEASCYLGKNNVPMAIAKLREAVDLYEESGVPMNYNYVDAATELFSQLLTDENNFAEAEALKNHLLGLWTDGSEASGMMRLRVYDKIYAALMLRMRFGEALEINEKLLALAESYPDFNSFVAMSNRLMLLTFLGRKAEAADELDKLFDSTLDKYGKYSKQHMLSLLLNGVFIDQSGDLSRIGKVTEYGRDMIEIAQSIYKADDPERFRNTIWGAKMLGNTEPGDAVAAILDVLKLTPARILESDPSTVVNAYSSLATIKAGQWELDAAAKYIEKAMEVAGDGTKILNVANVYLIAGQVYTKLNRLADAERALLRADTGIVRMNGGDMALGVIIYNALAELYSKMGQYALAADYRAKCETLQADRYGDNKTVATLNLLSGLWPKYWSGDKEGCLSDINAIEEIIVAIGNKGNVDASLPSRLKAMYYYNEKDYEKAGIYADIIGLWPLNYDNRLVRSKIFHARGEYSQALEEADAAIGISRAINGDNSIAMVEPVALAAELRLSLGDRDGAIDGYKEAYRLSRDYISDNILTLTAAQRADFWNNNFGFYRSTLPYVTDTYLRDTEMNGLLYDAMLFSNGLLFNADRSIASVVQKSPEDVRKLYSDWMFRKDLLKRLVAQAEASDDASLADDFKRNIARVTGEVTALERKLLERISATGGGEWRLPRTTWQQVRKALPRDAAAIEFVSYNRGDSIEVLLALILTKELQMPVLREVARWDLSVLTNENMFADQGLTDAFFRSFAADIAGCTTVYFVAQGPLCSVAVESLPVSAGVLPSKPDFYRLTSTRELVRARRRKNKNKSATLYGGLKYDMAVDSMVADADRYPELRERGFNADNLLAARVSRKGNVEIPELKGALAEVESVSDFYKKVTGHTPLLKTGADGTEASIKALSGKYGNIFHISTHGFFLADDRQTDIRPVGQSETLTAEDIALERSGLLMAGAANRYLDLEDIPSDIDDGILTAAEIARLDLEGVDLAVLSACETGLGEVTGDGVFGLQRGFKKAGVNSILMSLWKVDDDATCRLITEFYRHWLGDPQTGIAATDKYAALETAKRIVRTIPGWESPRYWAAFILLDAAD